MSAGYDGNIKLGVSVTADSKSVVAELGALRKQIVDMFSSVDKSLAGGSGSFSNLEKTLSKISTDVASIAKAITSLPESKVAQVVETVKEVGTAAQQSGDAVKSAFDFNAETASTEELYQKLKRLRAEAEAIKQQKLAEGFSPVQANNSKDVRIRENQASAIANELRNRGLSDKDDYMPATNFSGDIGDVQVKNLEDALKQAYEALHELQSGLSSMNEDDDGFAEKTARVNELTQAIANLNEQLGFEKARISGVSTSTDGDTPKTQTVSSHSMGYDMSGVKYIEISSAQGKEAAEAFIAQYNEVLASQGREAADAFAKSFNVAGDSGDSMIAQYKRELAGLQSRMKDFDKLKITMSDEEVGKTLNRIEELKAKIAELTRDAKFFTLDVPVDDGLRDNMMAMQELQTKMKQFQQTGTGFGSMEEAQTASATLARLAQSVNEYFRSLDPAQQKLSEYKQALSDVATYQEQARSGKSMSADDTAHYEAASAKVKEYKRDLASLIQVRNALKSNISQFEKTGIGMNTEELKQSKALLADVSRQCDMLAGSADRAGEAMSKLKGADKAFSRLRSTISGIVKQVGKLASSFVRLGKTGTRSTNSIGKSFKHSFTNMLKYGLGIRSIFMLFRRLRSTALESLQAIASQFPHINAQFSETKTLLSGLKGSFGTLALPLITAVLPAINAVISALTAAIQLIARFFAVLSGGGVIYKATAKTQDFADSMGGAGGAAKDAVKSLMAFDELNLLQDDAGGGGGGGADWEYEEEEVDPESAIAKFAEMVKQAWATGDFTDVGAFLGELLRDGLNKLDAWITTEGYALSKKIGNSFATLINGIVSVDGLADSVGRTVADAINMAMIGLHQFLTVTEWLNVGKFVADTIMSFFHNIQWELLGQTVGSYIMAFVDSIYGFITNIDFEAIGKYIATAINNIFDVMGAVDETGLNGWQKLGKSLSDGITGLLEMILKAIKEVDWGKIGQAIGDFIESIDFGEIVWDVTALIANLVAAIAEGLWGWAKTEPISAALASMLGLAVIGTKIAPTVVNAIELFKKFKDVLSIMDTIDDLGTALEVAFGPGSVIAGIGMVIGGAITAVTSFFSMLKNGFSWLKEILMVIGIAIAAVGAIILGAPAVVAGVVAAIVAAVATLVVVVKEHWTEICDWFASTWEAIKEGWNSFWTAVGEVLTDVWESVTTWFKETWNSIVEWFTGTWESIKEGWNNFWTSFGEVFMEVWNGISAWFTETWNGLFTWFQETWASIQEGWNTFWTNFGAFFMEMWNGLVTWFQETWLAIQEGWNAFWTGISDFFIEIWTGITTWFTEMWLLFQENWTMFWSTLQQVVVDIWTAISTFFGEVWNTIQTTFNTVLTFIRTLITNVFNTIKTTATTIWTAISTFFTTVLTAIQEVFTTVWTAIGGVVSTIFTNMKNTLSSGMNSLKAEITTILNTIKSTFVNIWNGIKSAVTNIANGMKTAITGVMNGIKNAVSGVAGSVKNAINTVIRALNGLKFSIPSWVPGLGGKSFGFNIPYLAQGAVLPPNKPFMAMVGDQKHGTNIEAPLDTIKQAVAEELSEYIDAMMAGFEAVVNAIDNKDMDVSIGDSEIGRAAERYQRRQKLVRGV